MNSSSLHSPILSSKSKRAKPDFESIVAAPKSKTSSNPTFATQTSTQPSQLLPVSGAAASHSPYRKFVRSPLETLEPTKPSPPEDKSRFGLKIPPPPVNYKSPGRSSFYVWLWFLLQSLCDLRQFLCLDYEKIWDVGWVIFCKTIGFVFFTLWLSVLLWLCVLHMLCCLGRVWFREGEMEAS